MTSFTTPPCNSTLPSRIVFPDLISYCNFNIRHNRHGKHAAAASKQWLLRGDNLSERKRQAFLGLKCGQLASMCYPDAGNPQLRVCMDFMNYLFHLDDLSDDMDIHGTKSIGDVVMNSLYHPHTTSDSSRLGRMTRGFWKRLLPTASTGAQQRFIETFGFFFQAVTQQAKDRHSKDIPDLESYISLRRDTSGCKPCWALIEYANNLNIPDEVMDDPLIRGLGEAANDFVSWSNDMYSFNVEQADGHTHNMVAVVMNLKHVDIQDAINFVGDLCILCVDRFNRDRSELPSWGPKIDKDVAVYVDGLANWMVGNLHWTFETERYFGKNGKDVKASGVVDLLPRSRK